MRAKFLQALKQAAIAAQARPGLTSAGIRSSAEGLQAAECNPAITRSLTTSRAVAADGPSSTSSSTGPSRLPATKATQLFGPAQFAAANRTAALASTSGAPSNTAPPFPKLLGFAGAIPFVTLAPAMVEALGQPDLVEKCAQAQLFYGGSIVSFLGAVHWGMAMGSTLSGSTAARSLVERYTWSVVPSIAVVPALLMHPAQGSLAISSLLVLCYLSDRSYAKMGLLPAWYQNMRGQLTVLAALGMLSTTAYYFQKDVERMQARMAEDDARAAARRAASVQAMPALDLAPAQPRKK